MLILCSVEIIEKLMQITMRTYINIELSQDSWLQHALRGIGNKVLRIT